MARRRHGETSTSRCVDKRRATNRRRSVLLGHAAVALTLDVSVNYRVPAPLPPRYTGRALPVTSLSDVPY